MLQQLTELLSSERRFSVDHRAHGPESVFVGGKGRRARGGSQYLQESKDPRSMQSADRGQLEFPSEMAKL